jgi:protein involved in temperature-dependent protein secretion
LAASKAVVLKPDFVMARDLLAKLYLESGQLEKAEQQCRMALRDNPSDQEALYHLNSAPDLPPSCFGSEAVMEESWATR